MDKDTDGTLNVRQVSKIKIYIEPVKSRYKITMYSRQW